MKYAKPLTIDIFCDRDTPDADIDRVASALDALTPVVGKLAIQTYEHDNTIPHLTNAPTEYIDSATVNVIESAADFTMHVSTRALTNHHAGDVKSPVLRGESFILSPRNTPDRSQRDPIGVRVALVSTHDNYLPEDTAQHELLHLFGIKTSGEHYDGAGHCTDKSCLMFKSNDPSSSIQLTRSIATGNLVRKQTITYQERDVCDECAVQTEISSYWLRRALAGDFVPDTYVFPRYDSPRDIRQLGRAATQ